VSGQDKIPFSKPYITEREHRNLASALGDKLLAGDQRWTDCCRALLEGSFGAYRALLTTSASSALDMTALLLEIKAGDEVIMPSFNFPSMANAVAARGARPVFADIDPETLCLDIEDAAGKITAQTRAIYPVHYAGNSCDMDKLLDFAEARGLTVVEDAAQSVNARYKGRYLGTLGGLGCYSFHESKNFVCGEGGALLINHGNEAWARRAEIIREKGTNRSQFLKGQVDKYTWVDIGSSYLLSDLLAAVLAAQLDNREENHRLRACAYNTYLDLLQPLADAERLALPRVPAYNQPNYHIFYILLNDEQSRDGLMRHLQAKGISACFHYVPLHSSAAGLKFAEGRCDLPHTDDISRRLLRLPLFCEITDDQLAYIAKQIRDYLK